MGDYANHSKETGKGLCNSYEDVVAAGRADSKDLEEKAILDAMLKKLAHYETRFTEHYKSIDFAKKKKVAIQTELKNFHDITNFKYSPKELEFLE